MAEKRVRCVVNDGRLEPCDALGMAFGEPNRKGVAPLVLFSLNTMATRLAGAVLRSGDFAKRGVLMNFCPFCGVDIGSHLNRVEDAEKAVRA